MIFPLLTVYMIGIIYMRMNILDIDILDISSMKSLYVARFESPKKKMFSMSKEYFLVVIGIVILRLTLYEG